MVVAKTIFSVIAWSQNTILLQGLFHPKETSTRKIQLEKGFIVEKFIASGFFQNIS